MLFFIASQHEIYGKKDLCAPETTDVEPVVLGAWHYVSRSSVVPVLGEFQAATVAEAQIAKIAPVSGAGGAGSTVQSTEGLEMTSIKAEKLLRNTGNMLGYWTLTTQALMNSGKMSHVDEQRNVNRNHIEDLKVTLTFLIFFCALHPS